MRFHATLPLLIHLLVVGPSGSVHTEPVAPTESARTGLGDALKVLHTWDHHREDAWAAVDAAALRALYEPGSGAGRADLRLLRAYASRGLVVRRIVTQVFAVRVLHRTPSVLRLRVCDRVAGGEMVEEGHVVGLPSSRPVTREIELRLGEAGWRVASVSGSGRGPHAARR